MSLKVLQKLEMISSHTCLTSLENNYAVNETFQSIVSMITHTHTMKISKQMLKANSGGFSSRLPKARLLSNVGGSVGRSDTGVVEREFFNRFIHQNGVFGWFSLSYFSVFEGWWWELSIYPWCKDSIHFNLRFFPEVQCLWSLTGKSRCYLYPAFQHWEERPPSIQLFFAGWEWLRFAQN